MQKYVVQLASLQVPVFCNDGGQLSVEDKWSYQQETETLQM